jgi:hypothetical protein
VAPVNVALIVAVVAAALAGCVGDSAVDGGSVPGVLNGAVTGWQEGRADLVAAVFDGQALRPIAHGGLDAAGNVYMRLPEALEADLLAPLADVLPCRELAAVPREAGVARLFSLDVVHDGRPRGAIAQASSQEATFPLPSEVGAYRVFRWYADRDASVTGTCASTSGGYAYEHRWALDLERGWNIVVETINELTGDGERRETRAAPLPDGTNWYFLDVMMVVE